MADESTTTTMKDDTSTLNTTEDSSPKDVTEKECEDNSMTSSTVHDPKLFTNVTVSVHSQQEQMGNTNEQAADVDVVEEEVVQRQEQEQSSSIDEDKPDYANASGSADNVDQGGITEAHSEGGGDKGMSEPSFAQDPTATASSSTPDDEQQQQSSATEQEASNATDGTNNNIAGNGDGDGGEAVVKEDPAAEEATNHNMFLQDASNVDAGIEKLPDTTPPEQPEQQSASMPEEEIAATTDPTTTELNPLDSVGMSVAVIPVPIEQTTASVFIPPPLPGQPLPPPSNTTDTNTIMAGVKRKSPSSPTTAATTEEDYDIKYPVEPDVLKASNDPIEKPTPNDILFGRGGLTNHHPGNRRFRDIVALHKEDYMKAIKIVKPRVARKIIKAIRTGDPPGRFLKKREDGMWYDVGDRNAAEKASQALREKSQDEKRESKEKAKGRYGKNKAGVVGVYKDYSQPHHPPHGATAAPGAPVMYPGMPPPGSTGAPPPPYHTPPGGGKNGSPSAAGSTPPGGQQPMAPYPYHGQHMYSMMPGAPMPVLPVPQYPGMPTTPGGPPAGQYPPHYPPGTSPPPAAATPQESATDGTLKMEEVDGNGGTEEGGTGADENDGTPATAATTPASTTTPTKLGVVDGIMKIDPLTSPNGDVQLDYDVKGGVFGTKDADGNMVVTEYDILCGRGGATNHHQGNKRFRDIVAVHRPDYVRAPKVQKPGVARMIVKAIRSGIPPGRFLKKDASGKWFDIGDKRAAEKASQALREKPSEEKKHSPAAARQTQQHQHQHQQAHVAQQQQQQQQQHSGPPPPPNAPEYSYMYPHPPPQHGHPSPYGHHPSMPGHTYVYPGYPATIVPQQQINPSLQTMQPMSYEDPNAPKEPNPPINGEQGDVMDSVPGESVDGNVEGGVGVSEGTDQPMDDPREETDDTKAVEEELVKNGLEEQAENAVADTEGLEHDTSLPPSPKKQKVDMEIETIDV